MGWFIRKSVKVGPVRINLSKHGVGMSTGVKGFRVGTGPRGPYVAGGRGGLYFRQRLGGKSASSAARPRGTPVSQTPMTAPSASVPASGPIADPLQPATAPSQFAIPRHLYSGRVLAALSGSYAAAIVLIMSDPATNTSTSGSGATTSSTGPLGTAGTLIWLGVLVAICILDWRGATSLNGFLKWRSMRTWQQLVVGFLLFCLSFLLVPVYLIQAFNTYRHAKQMEPALRQQRVAQLEADLGIMPATEGVCRACGKPLQVGAEFCAYCATPVVAKPRICPVCATTTLPDAAFCPNCRAPLPAD
ncbi:MAG TPA: DUF4236 domain-containing protein [Ktedonobacterales bacterium]|nr:DUF4236 domain-containing protein [Ktedonobacterales bacterium]